MPNAGIQKRIVPAPLLTLACLGSAALVDHFHSLQIFSAPQGLLVSVGVVLIVAALAVGLAALREFRRHHTSSSPFTPATSVVSSGIFRLTRNPMYLSFVLIGVGLAVAMNSWWLLAATVLLVALMHHLVIKPEEAYLLSRFGAQYEAYLRQTRRWL